MRIPAGLRCGREPARIEDDIRLLDMHSSPPLRCLLTAGACIAVSTFLAAPASAQEASPSLNDWPSYNRTLPGDRFSPLTEIARSNVSKLRMSCSYSLPEVTDLQTGLVVVDGTMYFSTDTITYAIDAGSCAERWKVVRHKPTRGGGGGVNRGVAVMDGRVFRGTDDSHVLALDVTAVDVVQVAVPGLRRHRQHPHLRQLRVARHDPVDHRLLREL